MTNEYLLTRMFWLFMCFVSYKIGVNQNRGNK